MNKIIDFLIPPFFSGGGEPSYLSFCHPAPVLLFFTRANTPAESKGPLRSKKTGVSQPSETCGEQTLGSEGWFFCFCLCLLKFTDWCSHFTLHLQMSSCHIWWPPSRNRHAFRYHVIQWVSVENYKSYLNPTGVPTAKWKGMTPGCFSSFMYSHSSHAP